ncbi:MAG: hypothetical protein EAZ55_12945 [Cytophagales bacterium]|nr:MAG: hypothetical protein EAZ55_12945 [Cytophagales bacterium]
MEHNDKPCKECEKCLEILQIITDEEASLDEKELFFEHLKTCTHCAECYNNEKNFKECIQKRLERRKVPQELKVVIAKIVSDV